MSTDNSPLDSTPSWSETTTPTSEDLNREPLRAGYMSADSKRVQRKPSVRRRGYRPSNSPCEPRIVENCEFPDRYLDLERQSLHRQALETSQLSAFDINVPKSLPRPSAWRPSGYIESEEVDEGEEEEDRSVDQAMEDAMMIERDDSEEVEGLLEPKVESPDGLVGMDDVQELRAGSRTPQPTGVSFQAKRPRGRPRKHPAPNLESLAKVAKGRSKTGCITCRKRKKKCDEAKPRCMNCEKNAVLCEGYPERTVWKSGRQKAEEAQLRRVSLPNITLQPVIHGVETSGDRIFFEHYVFRLSTVLTVEGPRKNAFKDMLLPLAVQHLGLMHSILALSSSNIDYQAPYGKALLAKYPDVTENRLQVRAQFHQEQAMKEFNLDIRKQQEGAVENAILSARYGQMLCLVVQSIAEGRTTGEHRIHLQAYQALMRESPPEDGPFLEFIREYFQFHIAADDLICLPENSARLIEDDDSEWKIPTAVQPEAMRMIGVQDGLFYFMSKITVIRNLIRTNMAKGIEPVVDYTSLYRAAEIDAGIRDWKPSWAEGDRRDLAGMLYKQMMWVYLWRTIYPPKSMAWTPDPKITQAVDDGLLLLGMFEPSDPNQTILLAPAFSIGCAAFHDEQRVQIRKSIKTIREYTSLKNADRALEVLEEVWRFMDEKDERSWDWQSIAHEMGLDFLAT